MAVPRESEACAKLNVFSMYATFEADEERFNDKKELLALAVCKLVKLSLPHFFSFPEIER